MAFSSLRHKILHHGRAFSTRDVSQEIKQFSRQRAGGFKRTSGYSRPRSSGGYQRPGKGRLQEKRSSSEPTQLDVFGHPRRRMSSPSWIQAGNFDLEGGRRASRTPLSERESDLTTADRTAIEHAKYETRVLLKCLNSDDPVVGINRSILEKLQRQKKIYEEQRLNLRKAYWKERLSVKREVERTPYMLRDRRAMLHHAKMRAKDNQRVAERLSKMDNPIEHPIKGSLHMFDVAKFGIKETPSHHYHGPTNVGRWSIWDEQRCWDLYNERVRRGEVDISGKHIFAEYLKELSRNGRLTDEDKNWLVQTLPKEVGGNQTYSIDLVREITVAEGQINPQALAFKDKEVWVENEFVEQLEDEELKEELREAWVEFRSRSIFKWDLGPVSSKVSDGSGAPKSMASAGEVYDPDSLEDDEEYEWIQEEIEREVVEDSDFDSDLDEE